MIREARDGGATVFLTTHDMVTANELCDRVAFLVDGQMAALDSPRSLRLAHGRKVVPRRGPVRRNARRASLRSAVWPMIQTFSGFFVLGLLRRFIRSRPRSRRCSCASPEGRWHDRDPDRAPVG